MSNIGVPLSYSPPADAAAALRNREFRLSSFTGLASLAIILAVASQTAGAVGIAFSAEGMNNIGQILAPVVLMSLFIERVTEVLISAWRVPESQRLQHAVDVAEADYKVYAQRELDFYRIGTQRLAFTISFTFAVVTALVGFRVVEPLLDAASVKALAGGQKDWLRNLDIVLAGLLMAGGADGIHKIVTTFTAFLDATRNRAAASQSAGATQPAQAPLAAAPVQQNTLAAASTAASTPQTAATAADSFDDGV